VAAYEQAGVQFIISARKTSRLVDELKAAAWTGSPKTDADGQCEFRYQPEGWSKAYRFIALRYQKKEASATDKPEQYQLFDTPQYSYRVFVLGHTTLATTRLKFLFLAARIWSHAGRVGVSYSDHYAEQSLFERLMTRLRSVASDATGFRPVIPAALRC